MKLFENLKILLFLDNLILDSSNYETKYVLIAIHIKLLHFLEKRKEFSTTRNNF